MQYVGATEKALHVRMNEHCSDTRTRKTEKPVAAHFCQPDHSLRDLEVRGIEKIHDRRKHRMEKRERKLLDFYLENDDTGGYEPG